MWLALFRVKTISGDNSALWSARPIKKYFFSRDSTFARFYPLQNFEIMFEIRMNFLYTFRIALCLPSYLLFCDHPQSQHLVETRKIAEFFRKFLVSNTGLDKQKFSAEKMLIFSYQSVWSYFLGAQKNRLIETVLLSTHNVCFGWEIRKIKFSLRTLN